MMNKSDNLGELGEYGAKGGLFLWRGNELFLLKPPVVLSPAERETFPLS